MQADFSPPRIVSLQPSASVILARLEMLDRLVACTRYCKDVVPGLGGITIVSDSWTAQAEQIIAAQPDLVIAAVPYQLESVAQILKAGIRFLGLAPKSLADIYTDIAAIAGVMGTSDRGQQIISEMQREIAAAWARNGSTSRKPRVFCEEWGKPIIHSQHWVAELVEAAGGKFVGEPGAKAEADAISRADPDVIVLAWCGAGDRVPLQKIVRERRWQELQAVRQNRVYCISDELLNTPAPTLLDGLRALEAAISPERHPQPTRGLRRLKEEGSAE